MSHNPNGKLALLMRVTPLSGGLPPRIDMLACRLLRDGNTYTQRELDAGSRTAPSRRQTAIRGRYADS